jgi:hypothetical protein
MPEASGRLWISQADSDLWALGRLSHQAEPRAHCQATAKCQQIVEKSVKAIAAGLRDRLIVSIPIGYSHDVARIASALRRPAQPNDPTDIQHHINRLLTDFTIGEIKEIDSLVPRRPAPGALHARNTEYPFEPLAGDWTAPALGAFSNTEVDRWRNLAERLYRSANEIVSALRR